MKNSNQNSALLAWCAGLALCIPFAVNASEIVVQAEQFSYVEGDFADGQPKPISTYSVKGTKAINYVNRGDYAGYTIEVPESGDYTVTYFAGTDMDSGTGISLQIEQDGVWKTYATASVPKSGWDNFKPISSNEKIPLPKGEQKIRILASGTNDWQWNLSHFNLAKVAD
ncbi:beta-agarase precursor [Vibrio astriarenae]|uniref:Carbohydrate-binding protein n=1 Tax=Vibrio astriarenae TaxID=1481923 RepID=A0A7Z2T6V3_9VIBR|nr:carbohydrate-binding protein [Vibrio astriarenae]QIA65350.1 carbohydrate-binding protein [Vibrio astriarenae]GAL15412.1 beta-agarase precursor [Vibrio sp. C7]